MRCSVCDKAIKKEHYSGWYGNDDLCPDCVGGLLLIPIIEQDCKVSKKEMRDTLDLIMGVRSEDKL